MANENEELIVLYDEDGNEQAFEYLDTMELDENVYVVLSPVYEDAEESEDTEVVFMKIVPGEDDSEEDILEIVDSEEELEFVFEEFSRRYEDEFEQVGDDE